MNAQGICQVLDKITMLISRIIQNQVNRQLAVFGCQLFEQLCNRFRVDVSGINHRFHFQGHNIERSQNVDPVPAGSGFDKHSGKAPQNADKGHQNEMGCISKEQLTFSRLCLRYQRH